MYNIKEFENSGWDELRFEILETALGAGLVGTYVFNIDSKIVYADNSLCAMFGIEFSPNGISFDLFTSRIHPDDGRRTARDRDASLRTGGAYVIEYRALSDNNEYRWLLARAAKKRKGQNNFYYGVVVDIHDRKLAEEALSKQNQLTKTITDNATEAIFMMDMQGYCSFMNPAAEKLTGFSFEEIRQKPLHYLIHHSHSDGTFFPLEECPIARALPDNVEVRSQEDVFFRKDGSQFPVSYSASPIYQGGVAVATIVEVRDLTQQKKAEALIHRKTKNLQILNNIGQAVLEGLDLQSTLQKVTDVTTQYTHAEFGAFFYNQSSKDEPLMLFTLSGAPREAFEKFGMPRHTEIFGATLSQQQCVRIDDIRLDERYGKNKPYHGIPEGHLPVVSYMAVPVLSKSGKVLGALFFGHSEPGIFTPEAEEMVRGVAAQAAIAIDNSSLFEELKDQNRQNERLLELSQQSERKKDEFISIASHELKTPLTTTKAYVQLCRKLSQTDGRLSSLIAKAEDQLGRLERLVSDLLDVSKVQAGKMIYEKEQFSFDALLAEAVAGIQLTSASHQIIIEKNDSVILNGDKDRIEQVLNNILSNALKYSPGSDKVIVRSEIKQENLVVSIEDFGIGIDSEHLSGIFDRFYRVDNTSMRFQGLGLGLYISSQIIKRHGGSFWIESQLGKGSTFNFLIPLRGIQELEVFSTDHRNFYKSNFLDISYDQKHEMLEANWTGFQNLETVKEGCKIMLTMLSKNSCSLVLNNNSEVAGNWSEAVDWVNQTWFPAMKQAGLKKFAWIFSPSTFARMSAMKTLDGEGNNTITRFFTELNEAKYWLSQSK